MRELEITLPSGNYVAVQTREGGYNVHFRRPAEPDHVSMKNAFAVVQVDEVYTTTSIAVSDDAMLGLMCIVSKILADKEVTPA